MFDCFGFPDFSLRDIVKPEPQRTRIILSALANFLRFRDNKLVVFNEYSAQSEQYAQARAEAEQKRAVLLEHINAIKCAYLNLKKIDTQTATERGDAPSGANPARHSDARRRIA